MLERLKLITLCTVIGVLIASYIALKIATYRPHIIAGSASVLTADTLIVNRTALHLAYIEGLDVKSACDAYAVAHNYIDASPLAAMVEGEQVSCRVISGLLQRSLMTAECRTSGGDIATRLLSDGWAISAAAPSREDTIEREARQARLGAWATTCDG